MPKKSNTQDIAQETLVEKLTRLERENEVLKNKTQGDDIEIRIDSYIEVMSLYPGKLTLSTEPNGKGHTFAFSEFGQIKRIMYNELALIMENYRSFMQNGFFYILDDRIVRKHGLNDMYSIILNKSLIEKIIACDSKYAVKLYETASPSQRDIIDGMLIQELKNGSPDLNVISQISKIANKDLQKIAEEAKTLDATPVS